MNEDGLNVAENHLKDDKLVKYFENLGKEKEKAECKKSHAPYLTMTEQVFWETNQFKILKIQNDKKVDQEILDELDSV